MSEWQDRTTVITGGARGFGLAFARALGAEGAQVVPIDVDGEAVDAAIDALRSEGIAAHGIVGDVTDQDRMQAAMSEAAGLRGGVDLLINNAGLHSEAYSKPITEMGRDEVARLFDVNVMGLVTCTLAARPHMEGRNGASVVNISSSAAFLGARTTAYGVSKLAVAGLTLAFAGELGPAGIRVNAIAPGMILTDTIRAELSPKNKALARSMQVVDTDGAERDVVEAMLYLTSERARFVTGETLRVTGGMSAGV